MAAEAQSTAPIATDDLTLKAGFPMPAHLFYTLLWLAAVGAHKDFVTLSTGRVGMGLGKSQQAASRQLIELEQLGLIEKTYSAGSLVRSVKVTNKGVQALKTVHYMLANAVGPDK